MLATLTRAISLLLLALVWGGVGCSRPKPPVVTIPPPEVVVELPTVMSVAEYEDFTGRTRASKAVDLKTQITAELREVGFVDGADVSAGQLLFKLDATFYQADVDRANAEVLRAEADVTRAQAELVKAQATETETKKEYQLNANAPGGVNRLELLKTEAAMRVAEATATAAKASVSVAEAAVMVAKKQLAAATNYVNYSRISAPFAGRIGRRLVDPGTRVKQDDTILARLLQIDPLDVDFDVDDRTLLRLTTGRTGESAAVGGWRALDRRLNVTDQVLVGLPDRDDFPLTATLRFVDNQVNASTSTIQMRADIPNPSGELTPGLFVRVRVQVGQPRQAILVPEEAIGTDQQLKFVYVVNDKDEVEYRKVRLGQQEGPYRVVEAIPGDVRSGVGPKDRVIVAGLQRVRPGAKVSVKSTK